MSARGSFLIRLLLAMVVTLFIFATCYIGIGWAVWSRQPWLVHALGTTRFHHWTIAYANATAGLFPGDKDGDGVCDGLEYFYRTDSQSAASRPAVDVLREETGFAAAPSVDFQSTDVGIFLHHKLLIQPGERLHVRRQLVVAAARHPFPNRFQLRIIPPPSTLLSLPGETLDTGPLSVAVAIDGTFAFDLEIPSNDLLDPRTERSVAITNSASGRIVSTLSVKCIWKGPALIPTIKTWSPGTGSSSSATPSPKQIRMLDLSWPPATEAEAMLIEAARNQPGAEWRPIHIYPRDTTSAVIAQDLDNALFPYAGPLQFRVVPVYFTPPASRTSP